MKIVNLTKSLAWHAWKRWRERKAATITMVGVHCTGSDNQKPEKTNRYHINPNHISSTGCPRLCYTDFIDKLATIYRCNNPLHITYHAGAWNTRSLSVVMAFRGQKDQPPVEMIQATLSVLLEYCLRYDIPPIRPRLYRRRGIAGHREFQMLAKKRLKACPGIYVNMDAMRLVVCLKLQTLLREKGLYQGGIDGQWGRLSWAALKANIYAEEEPLVEFTPGEAAQVIRIKK
jgi:hypothetical protein